MQIVDPTMQILLCRSYMYTVDPTCRSYMQILHVDPTCTVDPTCRSYMQILHVDPTCTQVPVQWYMYGYGTWVPFLNLVQSHTVPGVPVWGHFYFFVKFSPQFLLGLLGRQYNLEQKNCTSIKTGSWVRYLGTYPKFSTKPFLHGYLFGVIFIFL